MSEANVRAKNQIDVLFMIKKICWNIHKTLIHCLVNMFKKSSTKNRQIRWGRLVEKALHSDASITLRKKHLKRERTESWISRNEAALFCVTSAAQMKCLTENIYTVTHTQIHTHTSLMQPVQAWFTTAGEIVFYCTPLAVIHFNKASYADIMLMNVETLEWRSWTRVRELITSRWWFQVRRSRTPLACHGMIRAPQQMQLITI